MGKIFPIIMRAKFPVTVHLFFFRDNKVLLLRRFNTGFRDGEYSVPAGHLDGNESVMAAAAREAEEEIGVQIEANGTVFSSVMHRLEGDERVDFFVHVRKWQGEPFNAEPDKCDDLCWADIEQLPTNMVPYLRQALGNHLSSIQFDEFGF
ncbi:MAG TPA: NUDIX domain-containing protein [Anaerolineales bacterium]|nr:NUDIX domain-containing protein [Anaerolineales bacterium]